MAALTTRCSQFIKALSRSFVMDERGNTLAIIAFALIPLLAIVGSAVDTARLYVVKVRLQQACDAGALAGRKFMTSSTLTLDPNAATEANAFFKSNFKDGLFASTNVRFIPSKPTANKVAGTATATVPMTLTSMMGFGDSTLSVTCEASYDVADLDIMFVLDTTGSMAYAATDTFTSGQSVRSYTREDGTTGYYTEEKNNARIKALRTAVINFYDTVAAAADTSTKIRYGFVPYTSTVNVGKIIPSDFMVRDTHTYSSRRPIEANSGASWTVAHNNINQQACTNLATRSPASGYDMNARATVRTVSSWSANTCMIRHQTVELKWTFGPIETDISGYIAVNWVHDPSKLGNSQSKWQGCIEERDTRATGTFAQNNLPLDLDPDVAPTNRASRWRPMWPDMIYKRGGSLSTVEVSNGWAGNSNYESIGGSSPAQLSLISCGKQAQRLSPMTRMEVANYVNHPDFRAVGTTYHDVGMIWGTRFLSPTGPFAADTAPWPGRKEPMRHLVFMTDGELYPSLDIYGLYGVERTDRRVTGSDTYRQKERHAARFAAVCEAARQRNITIWVIAFGSNLSREMIECASSSGNAFRAVSDTQLNAAFQSIAARVAMLRLTR